MFTHVLTMYVKEATASEGVSIKRQGDRVRERERGKRVKMFS